MSEEKPESSEEPQHVEVALYPDDESKRAAAAFGNNARVYVVDEFASIYFFQFVDNLDGMVFTSKQVVTEEDKARIPIHWRASSKVIMPVSDLRKFAETTLRLLNRIDADKKAAQEKQP